MDNPKFSSVMPSLPVSDMERAIAFYPGSLGFILSFRNGSTFAIVTRDDVQLGLIVPDVAGVPAGHGRCYCKLSNGIDLVYSDYCSRADHLRAKRLRENLTMKELARSWALRMERSNLGSCTSPSQWAEISRNWCTTSDSILRVSFHLLRNGNYI